MKQLAIAVIAFSLIPLGHATNKHHRHIPVADSKPVYVKQHQEQRQSVKNIANSEGSNVYITEGDTSDVKIRALAPLGLAPHNNTAQCIKVWGIATGTKDVQGIIGYPQRDRECDLDKAASDAFALGQVKLGWNFKCHMKTIQRLYKHKPKAYRHDACMTDVRRFYVSAQAEEDPRVIDQLLRLNDQLTDQMK